MDKSSQMKATPLTSRPDFESDDHSQTEKTSSPTPLLVAPLRTVRPVSSPNDVKDEIHNTTPPLMGTPMQTIRAFDDSNNDSSNADAGGPIKREPSDDAQDEIHHTTPPLPLMITPLQTIRPSSNDSNDADVGGPSVVPIKREPSHDETHNTTTSPPLTVTPLRTIRPLDAGSSTVPTKRGRGRPKGSKNSKTTTKKAKMYDPNAQDEIHHTTPPLPLMITPLQTIRPCSNDSNDADVGGPSDVPIKRESSHDETYNTTTSPPLMVTPLRTIRPLDAGSSTVPTKRGRGRPKGSKNSKTTKKKPKMYDPNSKLVKSCPNFDSRITEAERETGNQELVDSVLMRFDAVRRRLCQLNNMKGILTTAATNCRNLGVMTNSKRKIGPIPGVQVGDIFYFWGEMCLIGLHNHPAAGIDYMIGKDGAIDGPVATSVVTSGHYDDEAEDLDILIYTGQGGTDKNGQARDQRLVKGNLALEANKTKGVEVRVIRGKRDPNDKNKKIYIYDGLYNVTNSWRVKGKSGYEEFKFRLVRNPGQPSGYGIWKTAENLRNGLSNSRKGLILHDFSFGNERIPVSLVNEVDENDKSMPEDFAYTKFQYSSLTHNVHAHLQSLGCIDCRGGSSCQDASCICIQKNGGELPYHNSTLVCRKPMIYECSESCPCFNDCNNRVVQTGLKIRLEVFKTTNCGWGLRSWEPIRAGTFICEFAGVNKTKEEVVEDDEYVFDTSQIYNQFKWNYEPELLGEEGVLEQVFEVFNLPSQVLISGRNHGNVGRFMNHSCSPNVFWQPITSELNGKSYVRIAFFAKRHIPPMTELRYDYGVSCVEKIGEDETLFKGKKICLCGSVSCRGSFG